MNPVTDESIQGWQHRLAHELTPIPIQLVPPDTADDVIDASRLALGVGAVIVDIEQVVKQVGECDGLRGRCHVFRLEALQEQIL